MERIPCEQNNDCPVKAVVGRCFEDIHHDYFPRREYKTKIEKDFRNLDENKKLMCRMAHNAFHAMGIIPDKPSREEMLKRLN